jgi:hypothetical protein
LSIQTAGLSRQAYEYDTIFVALPDVQPTAATASPVDRSWVAIVAGAALAAERALERLVLYDPSVDFVL